MRLRMSYFGETLSNRHHSESLLSVENFKEIEWFRPPHFKHSKGLKHGHFVGTYSFNRNVELLNLGNASVRERIIKHTTLTVGDLDRQYSSYKKNLKVQNAIIKSLWFSRFDGTIITPVLTDNHLKDDLEGPEEVVLFMMRVKTEITLKKKKII